MSYRRRHTLTFTAEDPDGNMLSVHEFTRFADTSDLSGTDEMEVGKEYQTADGRHVNHVAKGRYEIVGVPGIPLISDDPSAP